MEPRPPRHGHCGAELRRSASYSTIELQDVEEQTMGVSHAPVGGKLLEQRGLAPEICQVIGFHHYPYELCKEDASDLTRDMSWILNFAAATTQLFQDRTKGPSHSAVMEIGCGRFGLEESAEFRRCATHNISVWRACSNKWTPPLRSKGQRPQPGPLRGSLRTPIEHEKGRGTRYPAAFCICGIREGTRTPDPQNHNLVL